jgi:hypothetical protein
MYLVSLSHRLCLREEVPAASRPRTCLFRHGANRSRQDFHSFLAIHHSNKPPRESFPAQEGTLDHFKFLAAVAINYCFKSIPREGLSPQLFGHSVHLDFHKRCLQGSINLDI